MATTRAPARTFTGSEILPSLKAALSALPEGFEITEFHAGENMQITALAPSIINGTIIGFETYAFDGEAWSVIGWD